jgi:hypothetical protein
MSVSFIEIKLEGVIFHIREQCLGFLIDFFMKKSLSLKEGLRIFFIGNERSSTIYRSPRYRA